MYVTFELKAKCSCCHAEIDGYEMRSMRINKRSMRSTGSGLVAFRECPDVCRASPLQVEVVGIHAKSLAEINDWRAGKDWPKFTADMKPTTEGATP